MNLTQEQVRQLLTYNKNTGEIFWKLRDISLFKDERSWKTWNTRYSGKHAGTKGQFNGKWYGVIRINSRQYLTHRVIWLHVTGDSPIEIDHEDSNGLNNKWSNLRNVTHQVNCTNTRMKSNNISGSMGVHWCNRDKRWVARIHLQGKTVGLGYYRDKQEAIDARLKAEIKYGFHENHGEVKHVIKTTTTA